MLDKLQKHFDLSSEMDHSKYILSRMNKFQMNRDFCDVCLIAKIDKSQILGHRIILSAASKFFFNMFNSDMIESRSFEVSLPEIPSKILEQIVNFVYTGDVIITSRSVINLLKWSHLYMLTNLVVRCETFMISTIHIKTYEDYDDLAEQYDLKRLMAETNKFIDDKFIDVYASEEFQAISMTKLKKILARDTLHVYSEENIFEAMEKWLQSDWGDRQKYIPELFSVLRFPLLDPKFIHDRVKGLSTSSDVLSIILDAFHWHLCDPSDRKVGQFCDRPRSWSTSNTDLVCYESKIFSYCSGWKKLFTLDYPGAGIDQTDYVVHGRKFLYRKDNKIFLINFEDVKPYAKYLNDDASNGAMCMAGNDLYIIGGFGHKKISKRVSIIDILTGCKREGTPMRERMHTSVAVYYEECIYTMGQQKNFKFDIKKKEWSSIPSRVMPRRFHSCLVHDMYLYVIGGESYSISSNHVERYNFQDNVWCTMTAIKKQGHVVHAGVFNQRILVVMNCSFRRDLVYVYDDELDKWLDFPSIPQN